MKVLLDDTLAAPVLRAAEPSVRRRLKLAIAKLAADPSGRSTGLDVKRLQRRVGPAIYRLRVGAWRIVFTIDAAIVVLRIFHRDDGYGWLQDMP